MLALVDASTAYRASLPTLDLAILAVYLLLMLAIGVWVGRGQKSTVDYFLGDRSLPWGAVLLSIVATETSTVTFLSVPGKAYEPGGDMRFLQITFGYIVGRIAVVGILLPLYFRGEPFTAYEVLQRRFGKVSRRATSLLFLVTRNLGDALRLYLAALALQMAMGFNLPTSIIVMGVVTIAYTYIGGVKSVIWNDCVQFVVYIVGAFAALYYIVEGLPGGLAEFRQFAAEQGKFRILDFNLSLTTPTMTFWAGLIGGMFLTAATHGTDQLTVQRLLTARSQRAAAGALVASGVVVMLQFALFLVIGAALACFYQTHAAGMTAADLDKDRVFSHFIVHHLPTGLVGLTLAAVFAAVMSTLSGSFNSSATTFVNDLVIPLSKRELSQQTQLRIGRIATGFFGVLQIVIALVSYRIGVETSIVDSVLKIASFAFGPLLGLYLLAVLAPRVTERPALFGFVVGVAVLSGVALRTQLAWPWYAAVGSLITFAVGKIASQFTTSEGPQP